MVIFGGTNGTRMNDVWVLENATGLGGAPRWTPLLPSGSPPSAREHHTAVYDPASRRATIFGGDDGALKNDVWALENATGLGGPSAWKQILPTGTPIPARRLHSAVRDQATDLMIVFGGPSMNDVWTLSRASGLGGPSAWTPLYPAGVPPPRRASHTSVLRPSPDMMVVFGGWSGAPRNDVCLLENATTAGSRPWWRQLSPAGTPPSARSRHVAAYDEASDRMIMSGGNDGGIKQDVWVLENATGAGGAPKWTQLMSGGAFYTREYHSAVFDPTSNRMVVFGGFTGVFRNNDARIVENATGLGGTPKWTALSPSGTKPAGRDSHTAVYDLGSRRMILFGGIDGSDVSRNDVWV
ncbi:MAG: Kelch repeat-containing protein, partial [Gemmatimonadales bacterium]